MLDPKYPISFLLGCRLKSEANLITSDDVASIKTVTLSEVDLTKMDNVDIHKAIQNFNKFCYKIVVLYTNIHLIIFYTVVSFAKPLY